MDHCRDACQEGWAKEKKSKEQARASFSYSPYPTSSSSSAGPCNSKPFLLSCQGKSQSLTASHAVNKNTSSMVLTTAVERISLPRMVPGSAFISTSEAPAVPHIFPPEITSVPFAEETTHASAIICPVPTISDPFTESISLLDHLPFTDFDNCIIY
ncbi:hypothetical protein GYMLUDRAFT_65067 [Collybiopsis luxurians FD-317 M1]|uniref:Uncharacterized protein n=1 Tax=Collybiopsis luxurians FD-317 M1 TaxID=944289 RepID=A0A0D0C882_9AGAR|nr:hypothetical protein GYMLUDRAFT_65067 [Collybiopsis luxurians FD-317 M1]